MEAGGAAMLALAAGRIGADTGALGPGRNAAAFLGPARGGGRAWRSAGLRDRTLAERHVVVARTPGARCESCGAALVRVRAPPALPHDGGAGAQLLVRPQAGTQAHGRNAGWPDVAG